MKRGRKPLPEGAHAQTKNITLDADLVAALNTVADRLEPTLGFRPTLSQTVKYMIKKSGVE
jgi:hypothetical protein